MSRLLYFIVSRITWKVRRWRGLDPLTGRKRPTYYSRINEWDLDENPVCEFRGGPERFGGEGAWTADRIE